MKDKSLLNTKTQFFILRFDKYSDKPASNFDTIRIFIMKEEMTMVRLTPTKMPVDSFTWCLGNI